MRYLPAAVVGGKRISRVCLSKLRSAEDINMPRFALYNQWWHEKVIRPLLGNRMA